MIRYLADGWRAKPKRRKRKRRKKANTGAASVNLMVHARGKGNAHVNARRRKDDAPTAELPIAETARQPPPKRLRKMKNLEQ